MTFGQRSDNYCCLGGLVQYWERGGGAGGGGVWGGAGGGGVCGFDNCLEMWNEGAKEGTVYYFWKELIPVSSLCVGVWGGGGVVALHQLTRSFTTYLQHLQSFVSLSVLTVQTVQGELCFG